MYSLKKINMDNFKIPLYNKNNEIVEYTYVDSDIYEGIDSFNWSLDIKRNKVSGKENKYAIGWIGNTKIYMHQFILGKSNNVNEVVIDHINNNGLDNRIANLKHSTLSANGQNCIQNKKNKTSKYLGVSSFNKGKWRARQSDKHIGSYNTEIEAAKAYDTFVLIKYGKTARTNDLVDFESIKDKIVNEKEIKNLPRNITYCNNKYRVEITIDKIKYNLKLHNTLQEAIDVLNKFKHQKKAEKINLHYSKPITINENDIAFIKPSNCDDEILVDKINWHKLSLNLWIRCDKGYAKGNEGQYMHRIIMNAKPDEKVDHINHNKLDNRKENLRISTSAKNNHNRIKSPNASSKYFGVYRVKDRDKWGTYIHHNNKKYSCGYFYDEREAAEAYNKKATELYGDFANLNHFEENNDTIRDLSKLFENIDINQS